MAKEKSKIAKENSNKETGKVRIAIPSMEAGGLEDILSGHFGHCPVFTLVDVEGKKVKDHKVLPNNAHEEGGCMGVVNLLKQNGVDVIVVGGIGMRPMMGFEQVGIKVYAGAAGTVEFLVNEFIEGRLRQAGDEVICGHSREPAHEHGPGCHHGH